MRRDQRTGFTLIELMIVVSILGILAAIALPRFAQMVRRSTEGATKGSLGGLRGALNVYYADMEGQYPGDLAGLTAGGKFLVPVPLAKVPPYHGDTSATVLGSVSDDSGGWLYDNTPSDGRYGSVWVNCTHTDTKASDWTLY